MQDMQAAPAYGDGNEDDSDITVETLVSWVEDAEESTDDARQLAERDRDYYDHRQLTSEERETLRKRGQPDVVINRIKPKIDYLLGYESNTRTDPRGMPRNPQDEGAAEAATDALRYVGDNVDINNKLSVVWEHMLIEGYGGVELTLEDPQQDPETGEIVDAEIGLNLWDWDRLFFDPHSRKLDYSDARFVGGYVWMDEADAVAEYPEGKDIIADTISSDATLGHTYEDRPRWKTWTSGKQRKRVRIVQMYYKEGFEWHYCVFTKAGKLAGYPVPFKDKDGMSFCPMLLQSAYVDRDNNRYGLVRSMIDVQDEINKRRSKALHLLMMNRVWIEHGDVDDVDMYKAELAKADATVVLNPGATLHQLDSNADIQGHLALLQESKNEIELLGPNSAMLGKDSDAPSGKAIQLNTQSGQTEISMLTDRYRFLKQRIYRHIWDLVRQYKKGEWWVRVTDDEKNVKFVGMNKPITMREDIIKKLEERKLPPEQAQQIMMAAEQDPMRGPMMDQVVRTENIPAEMDMDITLEQVPDVSNVQQEQFNAVIQLAQAGVTFPPKVYIKLSSIPNKKDVLDELEGGEVSPEEQQMKQEAMEIEKRKAIGEVERLFADVEKTKAETDKIRAETSGKAVDVEIAKQQEIDREEDRLIGFNQPDLQGQGF